MKYNQVNLNKILDIFTELGENLSLPLEHTTFFDHLYRQIYQLFRPDVFLIHLYNDQSDQLNIAHQVGDDGIIADQFLRDLETICEFAIRSKEPYRIPFNKIENNDRSGHLDKVPFLAGALICLPLLTSGRVIGTVTIYRQDVSRQFSDTDCSLLRVISSITATALYNASLYHSALNKATVSELVQSEMDEARLSAEAASVAKSQFLASMSHEIRTPMNGVINMAELLLDTQLNREQKRYVDIIQTSGDALLTIINDILDFSKIEAGQMVLEKKTLSVRKCIEDAIDLLTPQANQKKLELLYFIDNTAPEMIEGDITRIRQIIINLLNNSVKFTEEGEIFITLTGRLINPQDHPDLYELHFSVRDTGIGIPTGKQNQLFQAFNQLDASMSRKYGGTGLGLVICKQLSEMMGGRIWVESPGIPGEGSSFHFTIIAKAIEPGAGVEIIQPQPALEGKCVLIVTDQPSLNWILTAYCQEWGMQTWVAESRKSVLELLQSGNQFDLVILDRNIPETGSEMLAIDIHNFPGNDKMRLVLLSSFTQSEEDVSPNLYAMTLPRPIKPGIFLDILLKVMAGGTEATSSNEPGKTRFNSLIGITHPWKILLVEDNRVNQQVAQYLLNRLGYEIDICNNGFEALQAIASKKDQINQYDLILMDIYMPEMDGIETTQKIRQLLPAPAQPRIIALTADAIQHTEKSTTYPGMDGYISKPIKIEELTQMLIQEKDIENVSTTASPILVDPEVEKGPIQKNVISSWVTSVGNPIVFREIIDTFLEESPRALEAMGLALEQEDWPTIQKLSHTHKSTSATMGAMQLSSLFKELERMSSQPENRVANCRTMVQRIRDEYSMVSRDLTSFHLESVDQPNLLITAKPDSPDLPLIDMNASREFWSRTENIPTKGFELALKSFMSSAPKIIKHLETSITHGNQTEVIKYTKRLIQSAESIGAVQLTELARILEHQGRNKGTNEMRITIEEIKSMFARIVQFSQSIISKKMMGESSAEKNISSNT